MPYDALFWLNRAWLLALGLGEELKLRCHFVPSRVVVDPDVRVLQLKRKEAVAKL